MRYFTALVLSLQKNPEDGLLYYKGESGQLLIDSGCPRSILDERVFGDCEISEIVSKCNHAIIGPTPETIRARGYSGVLGWDFIKALGNQYESVFFDVARKTLWLGNENLPSGAKACPVQELAFSVQASYPVTDCSVYALGACQGAVGLLDIASPISMCNTPCNEAARLFLPKDEDVYLSRRTTTGVDGSTLALVERHAAGIRFGNIDIADIPLSIVDTPAMAQLGFADSPFLLIGLDILGTSFSLDFSAAALATLTTTTTTAEDGRRRPESVAMSSNEKKRSKAVASLRIYNSN